MGELRKQVQARKEKLIKKLINIGIYKSEDKHLFELTLTDIEQLYVSLNKRKSSLKERV
ncbi:Fur-regulated basic protein FbpA [Alkalihalobacillus sp. MEB130]|uniref:Fur-regulated basic protein FbpA n=1 Tax=Alkalihalobacillus sp. MEB130 TaxID=2976704 RepID=UPI0028DF4FEC|nr:Fur-regulated basic protein FbpA [Alkalihalobacillus sp. MEB130]MDT8863063.1 Fur-regulated basic protein FbpA [Alkalihalobacillus sp. MEB130]